MKDITQTAYLGIRKPVLVVLTNDGDPLYVEISGCKQAKTNLTLVPRIFMTIVGYENNIYISIISIMV